MLRLAFLALAFIGGAPLVSAATPDDPAARLLHARTLRCTFTGHTTTTWRNGQRTLHSEALKENEHVTYEHIDAVKGTGRIIGNVGAGDVMIRPDVNGGLWIIETSQAGFVFVSTVLPSYAAGTHEFIIVESRHSWLGTNLLAEQSSGSCAVLQ